MLRPSRSRPVTKIDIGAAFRRCNLTKTKSAAVQILGIRRLCMRRTICRGANARADAKLRRPAVGGSNVAEKCRRFDQDRARPANWRQIGLVSGRARAYSAPGPARLCRTPIPALKGPATRPGSPVRTFVRDELNALIWHFNCLESGGRMVAG